MGSCNLLVKKKDINHGKLVIYIGMWVQIKKKKQSLYLEHSAVRHCESLR